MEAYVLAGISAPICALAAAACGAYRVAPSIRRRWASSGQNGRKGVPGLMEWRLRNGYRLLAPLSERVLRSERAASALALVQGLLEERGWHTTPRALASVIGVWSCIVLIGVWLISRSLLAAFLLLLCAGGLLAMAARTAHERRVDAIRDAVPMALEAMQACFGVGFTLMQTFQQVAKSLNGPLADTFQKAAHILEAGGTAERALGELRSGACASELAFVAVALDVQHQSGGAMRQVLQAAAETAKGELALQRALRVQTAQAKLSARIVAVMPLILVAAFSLASPDFLAPFFGSVAGIGLLVLALAMQVSGVLLVRRALVVQGVSR